jgi:hypothetical protein
MTIPTPGSLAITKEREEQITKHGRTLEYDKEVNTEFQLTDAAAVLTAYVPDEFEGAYIQNLPPIGWSKETWVEMLKKPYKERLIIAGALIAAEIDRIS